MQLYFCDLPCGNFFEMTWHDLIQYLNQSSVSQILYFFFLTEVTHTPFGPKLCYRLSHDLLFEDFIKCCCMR